MPDIPVASSMDTLHPGMSIGMHIYVDRCRITDAIVLSMYTADSSCRLFTVPIRDLRRVAEAHERDRRFGVGRMKRRAQRL